MQPRPFCTMVKNIFFDVRVNFSGCMTKLSTLTIKRSFHNSPINSRLIRKMIAGRKLSCVCPFLTSARLRQNFHPYVILFPPGCKFISFRMQVYFLSDVNIIAYPRNRC